MRLYLIKRHKVWYDENVSFVVRARDEADARRLAVERRGGDESPNEWADETKSTVTPIPVRGPSEIIHRSFNAG